MRHEDLRDEECPIARSSAILGERWVWLILRAAFNGARRFEDYQQGTGAARTMLADRLGLLAAQGILEKRLPSGATSGHREYRLTDKGFALFPAYLALVEWGNTWTGLETPVTVEHVGCGRHTHPTVVCSVCREPLAARTTRAQIPRMSRG